MCYSPVVLYISTNEAGFLRVFPKMNLGEVVIMDIGLSTHIYADEKPCMNWVG